jgi:hypothetical protein
MRLMQADEAGASALECLYCGARSAFAPPYAVKYCDCRYPRRDGAGGHPLPRTARAA